MLTLRSRGAESGDVAPADQDAPSLGSLQPGDHAQRRGLAAARGAEQGDERAGLDGEAHARHGGAGRSA